LGETLKSACPVGSEVIWENGGGRQRGVILYVTSSRIKVRNYNTLAEYFLHAYRLTPEYGGEIL